MGETPQTPPTPPTTPPTSPPTTPEGPNFCPDSIGPTGRVVVQDDDNDGGGAAWGDVVARVDSAGNVVYYTNSGGQLKEIHFLTDFETWKDAVTSFEHKFNKTPGAAGMDRSLEFSKMDESELRDYFATYGEPPTSTGIAAGEYQRDTGVKYMDEEIVELLFSTYRAGVYYVEEGGCAKLFHFST